MRVRYLLFGLIVVSFLPTLAQAQQPVVPTKPYAVDPGTPYAIVPNPQVRLKVLPDSIYMALPDSLFAIIPDSLFQAIPYRKWRLRKSPQVLAAPSNPFMINPSDNAAAIDPGIWIKPQSSTKMSGLMIIPPAVDTEMIIVPDPPKVKPAWPMVIPKRQPSAKQQ